MKDREAAEAKRFACAACGALEKRVRCDVCGVNIHAVDAQIWWAMDTSTSPPSFAYPRITHRTCAGDT